MLSMRFYWPQVSEGIGRSAMGPNSQAYFISPWDGPFTHTI